MRTYPITRHEPADECDGRPATVLASTIAPGDVAREFVPARCPECSVLLCPCELAYGHDCEDEA